MAAICSEKTARMAKKLKIGRFVVRTLVLLDADSHSALRTNLIAVNRFVVRTLVLLDADSHSALRTNLITVNRFAHHSRVFVLMHKAKSRCVTMEILNAEKTARGVLNCSPGTIANAIFIFMSGLDTGYSKAKR